VALRAVRPSALPRDIADLRTLADQAFNRAAGAPLVGGNHVDVLRDAAENYPAWENAIREAQHTIHVEMYIVHRDVTGRRFVDLLAQRARDGVKVRVVYDWFGCGFGPLFGLFKPLIDAGGDVRSFNPPSVTAVFGWIRRNHRKLIVCDGHIAFISGLCIGRMWEGKPEKHQEPWRDTGVSITGPAAAHAEHSFAESWRLAGGTIDDASLPNPEKAPIAGSVNLRLIRTEPFTASNLRVDLAITSLARRQLWITDAYFVGHGPYLEALRRAAGDGVDVRLLLPRGSDVGWTVPISRTLYRALLEGGVRIFEWNGTMVHAKTAVADSRWARVGSTNLNMNSWIGNWELDVAIDDEDTARTLEAHYLADLEQSTEIQLDPRRRPKPTAVRGVTTRKLPGRTGQRVVRTVTGLSRSLGAAMTGNRPLEDFEYPPLLAFGTMLVVLALLAFFKPKVLAWPVAVMGMWAGLTLLVEAAQIWLRRRRK
jgi:cardiolipin synthase A/B